MVHEFSRKYRFMFNSNKSEVMIFGKQHKRKSRLGRNELRVVDRYKYLGLLLDKKMTWKAHLSKVHEKASKRMRALCGMGLKEEVSARALLRGC